MRRLATIIHQGTCVAQENKTETRNREATTQRSVWRGVVFGVLALESEPVDPRL